MSSQKFILFAEDDCFQIYLIKRACQQANIPLEAYAVVEDGNSAVKYLEQHSLPASSLIISDFRMPGLDGLGLLEWVRTRSSFTSIQFVLYSSNVPKEVKERANQLNCSMVCEKPCNFTNFVSFLSRMYSPSEKENETASPSARLIPVQTSGTIDSGGFISSRA